MLRIISKLILSISIVFILTLSYPLRFITAQESSRYTIPLDGLVPVTTENVGQVLLFGSTYDFGRRADTRYSVIQNLKVSADGSILAFVDMDRIIVWDVQRSWEMLSVPIPGTIYDMDLSPDGKLLAFGQPVLDDENVIVDIETEIWDTQAATRAFTWESVGLSLSFSSDSERIAVTDCADFDENTGCADNDIQIWDAVAGEQLSTAEVREDQNLLDVEFRPNSDQVAVVACVRSGAYFCEASEVLLWEIEADEAGSSLQRDLQTVTSLKFSPDGASMVIMSETRNYAPGSVNGITLLSITDQVVTVWGVETGSINLTLTEDVVPGDIYDVALNLDGTLLAVSSTPSQEDGSYDSAENRVQVWDVATQAVVQTLETGTEVGITTQIAFSQDSKVLLTAGGQVSVWGVPSAFYCVVSAIENVNVRSGAGTSFERVGLLVSGQNIFVQGQANGRDRFVWWQLPDGNWVRSDTVREIGDCISVPPVTVE